MRMIGNALEPFIRPEPVGELDPIHLGQSYVEQNQLRRPVPEHCQRFHCTGRTPDHVPEGDD